MGMHILVPSTSPVALFSHRFQFPSSVHFHPSTHVAFHAAATFPYQVNPTITDPPATSSVVLLSSLTPSVLLVRRGLLLVPFGDFRRESRYTCVRIYRSDLDRYEILIRNCEESTKKFKSHILVISGDSLTLRSRES